MRSIMGFSDLQKGVSLRSSEANPQPNPSRLRVVENNALMLSIMGFSDLQKGVSLPQIIKTQVMISRLSRHLFHSLIRDLIIHPPPFPDFLYF